MRTVLVTCAALATLAGCAWRTDHLNREFGDAYVRVFHEQQANPAAKAMAVTGLDSQEAAIISDSYRVRLAPKGAEVDEEPVLIVTPQRRETRAAMPAPSVPKE